MPKITVFSIDYDGCGDLLFDELFLDMREVHHPKLTELRHKFESYLTQTAIGSNTVEVYVGSNRQDRSLDKRLAKKNNSGLCFENYEKLCAQKKWNFRKLLLADIENNLPAGSAMSDDTLQCSFDRPKIKTLEHQLQDIASSYPEDKIDFYFFDDDYYRIMLDNINTHFAENKEKKPANINLVIVRYDWQGVLYKNDPTSICEIGRIKSNLSSNTASPEPIIPDTFSEEKNTEVSGIIDIGFWSNKLDNSKSDSEIITPNQTP